MLRVLIVEDSLDDMELVVAGLRSAGIDADALRVDSAKALRAALQSASWDAIISDYHVPGLGAAGALTISQELGYDGPFIVVSSIIGEETAVAMMKAGAHDFVMKGNLARLGPALNRELRDATVRRENLRAAAALKASERALRELAEAMNVVREEEKARIARELHDELGQVLTAMDLEIAWVGRKLNSGNAELNGKIESIRGMINGAVDKVRRIAGDLRPAALDELGLAAAIDWQLKQLRNLTGAEIELRLSHDEFSIGEEVAVAAFRIVQESLTNIARHAQASKVTVCAEHQADTLTIEVIDNGGGMAKSGAKPGAVGSRTVGLLGMRERAQQLGGHLVVESEAGGGTTVRAVLPCAARHVRESAA
jgi:signal transduction histidine kinase